MSTLQQQVDALMRLCVAEEGQDKQQLRRELLAMMERKQRANQADPESVTRQFLMELGTPDHLIGHPYVVQAILLSVTDRRYIDTITFGLYPQLAVQFSTTPARVERAIRHLIEVTWTRGDWEVLDRYFGTMVSAEKGKPTNSEFLARAANIVKQRLKQAVS